MIQSQPVPRTGDNESIPEGVVLCARIPSGSAWVGVLRKISSPPGLADTWFIYSVGSMAERFFQVKCVGVPTFTIIWYICIPRMDLL